MRTNKGDTGNKQLPLDGFESILQRLQIACGAKTDIELSQELGIKRQSVTAARKRGIIPPNWIILIGEKYKVSLDWLRYGDEPDWRRSTESQIERLKKICGIGTDEDFSVFIGTNLSFIKEIKLKNRPIPLSWILKISDKTDYSIDWLYFGTGDKSRDEIEKKLTDQQVEGEKIISSIDIEPIDEELIEKIVIYLEEKLSSMKLVIPPKWRAFVISTSYEESWDFDRDKRNFDQKSVDNCIKLLVKHGDIKKKSIE